MEQEETKTTAAAGAEMPPEAESWVQLHESELTELMQKQAKAAITELKRQEKQERKKEKYHNTFTLMKCYRDAVFHIENAISDGQQLELKGIFCYISILCLRSTQSMRNSAYRRRPETQFLKCCKRL